MFVREYMTTNPVTIAPDISVPAALRLMGDKQVRRLPVIDSHGKLVGIVSDKDLLHAAPSPATTLAIWEISDLLARLKVSTVMTRQVVTVSPGSTLEEAARIMADRKIGGLPVMDGKKLVGIITESDLFRVLLELMGGRRSGVRITVSVSGVKGTLAKVSNAIFNAGGNIVGLGINEIADTDHLKWEIVFKVQDASKEEISAALRPLVDEILDVREM